MDVKEIKEVQKLLEGKLSTAEIVTMGVTAFVAGVVIYSALLNIKSSRMAIKRYNEENNNNT